MLIQEIKKNVKAFIEQEFTDTKIESEGQTIRTVSNFKNTLTKRVTEDTYYRVMRDRCYDKSQLQKLDKAVDCELTFYQNKIAQIFENYRASQSVEFDEMITALVESDIPIADLVNMKGCLAVSSSFKEELLPTISKNLTIKDLLNEYTNVKNKNLNACALSEKLKAKLNLDGLSLDVEPSHVANVQAKKM